MQLMIQSQLQLRSSWLMQKNVWQDKIRIRIIIKKKINHMKIIKNEISTFISIFFEGFCGYIRISVTS